MSSVGEILICLIVKQVVCIITVAHEILKL